MRSAIHTQVNGFNVSPGLKAHMQTHMQTHMRTHMQTHMHTLIHRERLHGKGLTLTLRRSLFQVEAFLTPPLAQCDVKTETEDELMLQSFVIIVDDKCKLV